MRPIALLLLVAACHPTPAAFAPRGDPISSQEPTAESGGESAAQAASENGESTMTVEPPARHTPPTSTMPCEYDPTSKRYEQCQAVTDDGRCAAFGASCGPGDLGGTAAVEPCMFDHDSGRYMHCHMITNDGGCSAYGAWCGPGDLRHPDDTPPCMYDPTDQRMKGCLRVTDDGRCASYGSWCRP